MDTEPKKEEGQQDQSQEESSSVLSTTTEELSKLIINQVQEGLKEVKESLNSELATKVDELITTNLKNRVIIQEPKKISHTEKFATIMERVKEDLKRFG